MNSINHEDTLQTLVEEAYSSTTDQRVTDALEDGQVLGVMLEDFHQDWTAQDVIEWVNEH